MGLVKPTAALDQSYGGKNHVTGSRPISMRHLQAQISGFTYRNKMGPWLRRTGPSQVQVRSGNTPTRRKWRHERYLLFNLLKMAVNKSSIKLYPKVGCKSRSLWKVGVTEKWGLVDGWRLKKGIPPLWADVMKRDTPSMVWRHERGIFPMW